MTRVAPARGVVLGVVLAAALAAALALAGCHASDPCDSKTGVCVAVHVSGDAPPLDELVLTASNGPLQFSGRTGTVTPPIVLPVQLAFRLPPMATGPLTIFIDGWAGGVKQVGGSADVTVPPGGHASVDVVLHALGGGDLGGDLAGADFAGVDFAVGDLAGAVTLLPANAVFPTVPSGSPPSTQTFTLINATTANVLINNITVGATPELALAPSGSTCQIGAMLATQSTCTIDVTFTPTTPGSVFSTLTVSLGGPKYTSTIAARATGWINESVVDSTGTAPLFNAVTGTAPNDVWAGGNGGQLWHYDGAKWSQYTPPVGTWPAGFNIGGLYEPTTINFYVIGNSGPGAGNFYYSNNQGSTWQAFAVIDPGSAIGGIDPVHVAAGTTYGDMYYGWATGGFVLDRTGGGTSQQVFAIFSGGSTLFAIYSNSVYSRALSGGWSPALDKSASAFLDGGWAASAGEFYAVGSLNPCAVAPCNLVTHKLPTAVVDRSIPGTTNLYGVAGSSTNNVWVVGQGGLAASSTGNDTWNVETPTSSDLRAVWVSDGSSGSLEVFAVGTNGAIVHRYQ
jgi:hypothetical protein